MTLAIFATSALAQSVTAPRSEKASLTREEISDLKLRATSGDAKAQLALGRAYEEGNGVLPNDELAAHWYREAAERGDAAAQNDLGIMYQRGRGVPKDVAEAVRWYRQSAKQGYGNAMFNLGAVYYNKKYDKTQAYVWFTAAEEAGSSTGSTALDQLKTEIAPDLVREAEILLGQLYEKAEEVPRNLERAVKWYTRAAEQGAPAAALYLSHMYESGVGVPKDEAKSAEWRQVALKKDYPPAIFEQAVRLWRGQGVREDHIAAAKWFEKASRFGMGEAMLNLGVMHAKGDGVRQDNVAAYVWFQLAAWQEIANAEKGLEMISAKMTEKEIEKARRKARESPLAVKFVRPRMRTHGFPRRRNHSDGLCLSGETTSRIVLCHPANGGER